jgi:uncharacterized RDD family membrane protein YckC
VSLTEPESRQPLQAAGLPLRLAAMIYDGILVFGVVFIVSYVLLTALRWSYPLSGVQRGVLQLALFIAFGVYFVSCWARSGQTLALKTWRLRVVGVDGVPPGTLRATLRYLAAWNLWLPGLLAAAVLEGGAGTRLAVLAAGFALLLIPALVDPERRLLHDRWSGTRLVRL